MKNRTVPFILPWLSMLLNAYKIIDKGVAIAVSREEKRRNERLACKKGCENCCHQKDIPVYPLELVGIYWFSTEKVSGPQREILKRQLLAHTDADPCPFLIDGSCLIHPLRPVSCRQFNVFGKPCNDGKDPYFTRREDVLTPIKDYTKQAFSVMLPFYGIRDEIKDTDALISSIIHTKVSNLQSYDWKKLLKIMDGFDSKNRSQLPSPLHQV